MLCFQTIEPKTLDLLKWIQRQPLCEAFRLIGGTALALQIGHRTSIDLDFMGNRPIEPFELEHALREYGSLSVQNRGRQIQTYVLEGIHVDFLTYEFPWIEPPVEAEGLRLAGCREIAAMKLAAITNRGTRKDFIDLAFLLKRFDLDRMIGFYRQKFPDFDLFALLKSLAYFEDAETDPMPKMLCPYDWPSAKASVLKALKCCAAATGCKL